MKKKQPPAQQLVFHFNVLQVAVNLPGASMYPSSQERAVPDVPQASKTAKKNAAKSKPRKKTRTPARGSMAKSTTTRTVIKARRTTTSTTNTKSVSKRTENRR